MSECYVQWGYDLVKNSYLMRDVKREWRDDLYLNYLRPFADEFYCGNSPLIIFGGHDFNEINTKEHVTIRDGLIPLSIFFREHKPEDFECELHIHKDLWFIVPDEWKAKIKLYEVESKNAFSKENLPKKVFIAGILNSTLADPDDFEASTKDLALALGQENIEGIEFMAYFPDKRNDLWGSWDEEENILKYSKAIYQNLKFDIKCPAWRLLAAEQDYKNVLYYEINEGLFIKDSYVQNMVLSRGGGLLKKEPNPKLQKIKTVPASLYHQYVLYEFVDFEKEVYKNLIDEKEVPAFKRIIDHEYNGVRFNFEWEKWYATYIKNSLKSRKKKGL